jgi:hypothetical protein
MPTPAGKCVPPTTNFKLGVNFWNDQVPGLFGAGGGYVLVNEVADLQKVIGHTQFTPIFRFDYSSGQAVPNCIAPNGQICARGSTEGNCITCNTWIDAFTRRIDDYPQVKLYIVGNEPWNENVFFEQYVAAYEALWRHVHGGDGKPRDVCLLVAGQAPHRAEEGLNTANWLGKVADKLDKQGVDVDGYTIHANGFGLEYDKSRKGDNPVPSHPNRQDVYGRRGHGSEPQ